MSVGKPTRSGTTEKRSRNGGRLHGRTGGPGTTGQGWPVCYLRIKRAVLTGHDSLGSTETAGKHDSITASDRPSTRRKALGLTSVERRSFCFRHAFYRAPTPINNCDPFWSGR